MLQADPIILVSIVRRRLKVKRAELEQALTGVLKPHHRFLLSEQFMHIDTLDEAIRRVSQEIEMRIAEEEIS